MKKVNEELTRSHTIMSPVYKKESEKLSKEYNLELYIAPHDNASFITIYDDLIKYSIINKEYDEILLDYVIKNKSKLEELRATLKLQGLVITSISSVNAMLFITTKLETETWTKSPYSFSFYNSSDISWGYKPENSLRVADHWNFESNGSLHCETTSGFTTGWAVGQYKNGKYEILEVF